MSVEVMKQALEALEVSTDWDVNATGKQAQSMRAITALRQAIEDAEQQEPVAWRYNGKLHEFDPSDWATGPVTPLYTSPPASKPWVSLTDEERRELRKRNQQHDAFAKAIDAALKEKNNG